MSPSIFYADLPILNLDLSCKMSQTLSRTVEVISTELNAIKDEIQTGKQHIRSEYEALKKLEKQPSEAKELLIRQNLAGVQKQLEIAQAHEQKLEAERMFPLGFAPRSFSHRSLLSFDLFLFCLLWLFLSSSAFTGACASKCCWRKRWWE